MSNVKATSVPSTQQHINIAQIKNGAVVLKTGGLRRVVRVEPVNFALKSEEEKQVIIGQYQNFLNALHFPVQMIVSSRRLDISPYLARLEQKTQNEPNELLRLHALEYIDFVRRLTSLTNIMDKKFYAVVPYDPPARSPSGFLSALAGKKQSDLKFAAGDWKKFTDELEQRVQVVIGGLNGIGLGAQAQDTQQTIELFYSVYNPEEATTERLEKAEDLQAPIVSAKIAEFIQKTKAAADLPAPAPTIKTAGAAHKTKATDNR